MWSTSSPASAAFPSVRPWWLASAARWPSCRFRTHSCSRRHTRPGPRFQEFNMCIAPVFIASRRDFDTARARSPKRESAHDCSSAVSLGVLGHVRDVAFPLARSTAPACAGCGSRRISARTRRAPLADLPVVVLQRRDAHSASCAVDGRGWRRNQSAATHASKSTPIRMRFIEFARCAHAGAAALRALRGQKESSRGPRRLRCP